MLLGGLTKKKLHLILSFLDDKMNLPINEKELNTIISAMRLGGDTALYQKLWSYKMNYLNKQKQKEE
jgi:hypothetical protein